MDLNKLAETIVQMLDPQLQKDKDLVFKLIIVIIIICIVTVVGNVLLQLFFKNRDYKYVLKMKKAEKTIDVFQMLFNMMEGITNYLVSYDPNIPENAELFLQKIRELRRGTSINRLSLSSHSIKIIDDFADYCSDIKADIKKKNTEAEDKMIEKFKAEYNKL